MSVTRKTNEAGGDRGDEKPRAPKLGILLIDHGSKRLASNERMHSVAEAYQSRIYDRYNNDTYRRDGDGSSSPNVVVRAAHMEVAPPSILAQLRRLVEEDGVTAAICVPYFLSPGKHATIDVPNLINEARETLDGEGLLDYYAAGDSSNSSGDGEDEAVGVDMKKRKVAILSSKTLGSNMGSMLGVVDDLVRDILEEEHGEKGLGAFRLDFADSAANVDDDVATEEANGSSVNGETEEELLRRYANRAALLQRTLENKVSRLKTMTNRAALMEDALSRLKERQESLKEERDGSARAVEERERMLAEREGRVADLTDAVKAIGREKERLEDQVGALEGRLVETERGYNSTVDDLNAKLASAEEELQRVREEQSLELRKSKEQSAQTADRTEELRREVQEQQSKIRELQSQLADLLDAHAELEQLQDDTEASLAKYKEQLNKSKAGHQSMLEVERDEKEDYRAKWMAAQRQLEANGARLQKMLNESKIEYEACWKKRGSRVDEWRGKWEALNETVSASNYTEESTEGLVKKEEDWADLQAELKEAATAKGELQKSARVGAATEVAAERNSQTTEEQQKQLQEYL